MSLLRWLILISFAACAGCSYEKASGENPVIAPRGDVVLAANQKSGSVTMIELETGRVVRHIPVGAGPHEIAVSSDGQTAIVPLFGESFLGGAGGGRAAAVIDIASASVTKTVDLGANTSPHGVVFLRDNRTAAVASSDAKTVILLDTESGNILGTIETGNPPYLITRPPDGQLAYATNPATDTVSELNLTAKALTRTFSLTGNPGGIAVTPDGKSLWTARTEGDALSVIDLESGEIAKAFEGIDIMRRLAVSLDGKRILVTSHARREILVFDAAERQETGRITLDAAPSGVVFGAHSKIAYVTSTGANSILEIDVENRKVLRRFPAESSPDGIVFVRRSSSSSP